MASMNQARIVFALGLVLLLGSVGQLPHRHGAAEPSIPGWSAPEELHAALPTVSRDEATCPVCVLQRLLSQAQAAGVNALERPGENGVLVASPALQAGVRVACSGSPRGPPRTV